MSRYTTRSFIPMPTTDDYRVVGEWSKPDYWHFNLTFDNDGSADALVRAVGSSDGFVYPTSVLEETLLQAGESFVHEYNTTYVPFVRIEARSSVSGLPSIVRASGIALDIEALRLETPPQDRIMPRDFFMYDEIYTKIGVGRAPVWFPSSIVGVQAHLEDPAVGSPVILSVNKSGALATTIVIPAGQKKALLEGLAIPLVYGDYITVDVVGVGTSFPGRHLSVSVLVER